MVVPVTGLGEAAAGVATVGGGVDDGDGDRTGGGLGPAGAGVALVVDGDA